LQLVISKCSNGGGVIYVPNSCNSDCGINASEVVVIANGFAVGFAKGLSISDQNIWGNLFALIGASLLSLAAINQTISEQSTAAQTSAATASDTSSTTEPSATTEPTATTGSTTDESKSSTSAVNSTVTNSTSDTIITSTFTTEGYSSY